MLLNGLWNFSFENGRTLAMSVPGCFDATPEFACKRGKAVYWREVFCGGYSELHLEGIGLRAEIFWDDKKIGEELTAYTPLSLRFNAGEKKNHILKIVCDNTVEETPESEFRRFYDFYGFGGIYRDVTLRELPETSFSYVKIIPLDPFAGKVKIHIELDGPEKTVTAKISNGQIFEFPGAGDFEFTINEPKLWSPENPELYSIVLSCGEDSYTARFGLRSIEKKNKKLYLNGEELFIVGVNRHDVHPAAGAAMSYEQLRADLQMIKDAGMNFIRGSHYPQSQHMLDIADELGLLVWDEILGWENPLDSLNNDEFIRRQKSALKRMIRNSVNHPSVVFWGFLNEAFTNDETARCCVGELAETVRKEDSSRLVTFATMMSDRDKCLDIVDIAAFNTYPGWYSGTYTFFDANIIKAELDRIADFVQNTPELADMPMIISEIGAAALLGDHSGRRWSEEYQSQLITAAFELIKSNSRYSGVLFWQFCNTQVDDNERIMMRPRGFNNKGLVDEYRKPKLAWYDLKKLLTR